MAAAAPSRCDSPRKTRNRQDGSYLHPDALHVRSFAAPHLAAVKRSPRAALERSGSRGSLGSKRRRPRGLLPCGGPRINELSYPATSKMIAGSAGKITAARSLAAFGPATIRTNHENDPRNPSNGSRSQWDAVMTSPAPSLNSFRKHQALRAGTCEHAERHNPAWRRRIQGWRRNCFVPGSDSHVFVVDGLRFGINICYDTNFPESARKLADLGASLNEGYPAWQAPGSPCGDEIKFSNDKPGHQAEPRGERRSIAISAMMLSAAVAIR
jgi:hypothetical protein